MKNLYFIYQFLTYIITKTLTIDARSAAQVFHRGAFLWVSVVNIASFLTGVYALSILSTLSFQRLQRFRYRVSRWDGYVFNK